VKDYTFRSKSHPLAGGRKPVAVEEAFTLWFTTEEGAKVEIQMGRKDFINHAATIVRGLQDDPALNREVEDAAEQVDLDHFMELDTRKKRK
jgi:hypothetical protein